MKILLTRFPGIFASDIIVSVVLAGEIGLCAGMANGSFVEGHRKYGRKPIIKNNG